MNKSFLIVQLLIEKITHYSLLINQLLIEKHEIPRRL